jgi:hypothetical protein
MSGCELLVNNYSLSVFGHLVKKNSIFGIRSAYGAGLGIARRRRGAENSGNSVRRKLIGERHELFIPQDDSLPW